jgi:D-3-phosphoglycerate dehydrogenase / 2-oxoglutarate reductase
MRAAFVDANASLAEVMRRLHRPDDLPVAIHEDPDITPDALPAMLAGVQIAIDDHTHFPVEIVKRCPDLRHIVFLGTGARSYMDPEALEAECGVKVHIIKGYGDTAVAEMAFALMWGAARGLGLMHHAIKGGGWPRTDGMQLTGKTVGIIGFGGIGAEMARLCNGAGMKVLAWNRTPKSAPGCHLHRHRHAARAKRRGLAAPAAERRDARLPQRRTPGAHEAGRAVREHGTRGDRG